MDLRHPTDSVEGSVRVRTGLSSRPEENRGGERERERTLKRDEIEKQKERWVEKERTL